MMHKIMIQGTLFVFLGVGIHSLQGSDMVKTEAEAVVAEAAPLSPRALKLASLLEMQKSENPSEKKAFVNLVLHCAADTKLRRDDKKILREKGYLNPLGKVDADIAKLIIRNINQFAPIPEKYYRHDQQGQEEQGSCSIQ